LTETTNRKLLEKKLQLDQENKRLKKEIEDVTKKHHQTEVIEVDDEESVHLRFRDSIHANASNFTY